MTTNEIARQVFREHLSIGARLINYYDNVKARKRTGLRAEFFTAEDLARFQLITGTGMASAGVAHQQMYTALAKAWGQSANTGDKEIDFTIERPMPDECLKLLCNRFGIRYLLEEVVDNKYKIVQYVVQAKAVDDTVSGSHADDVFRHLDERASEKTKEGVYPVLVRINMHGTKNTLVTVDPLVNQLEKRKGEPRKIHGYVFSANSGLQFVTGDPESELYPTLEECTRRGASLMDEARGAYYRAVGRLAAMSTAPQEEEVLGETAATQDGLF
jgi:hypothetical protein